jgi:hypothetical protein
MVAAAVLAAAVAATPAGGWSFAHWGMTRAEVRAASGGKLGDGGDADTDNLAGGASVAGFAFAVSLTYADGRLSQIDFRLLNPGRCPALGDYLKKTYGRAGAERMGGYPTVGWTDRRGGNEIELSVLEGASCHMNYAPIQNDGG